MPAPATTERDAQRIPRILAHVEKMLREGVPVVVVHAPSGADAEIMTGSRPSIKVKVCRVVTMGVE